MKKPRRSEQEVFRLFYSRKKIQRQFKNLNITVKHIYKSRDCILRIALKYIQKKIIDKFI